MEWVELLLIALLIVTIVDIISNWRLGSKLSGKTPDEINASLQDLVDKVDYITSTQLRRGRELEEKLNKKISELNTKIADVQGDIHNVLKTFDSRSSSAAKAIKVYALYLDANVGGEAEKNEFLEYVNDIPEELTDLKSFADGLKAKLEAK